MKKLSFAIVGLGFIAPKHLEAIEHVSGQLIAACDIDESRRELVGDIPFFTRWDKMLLSPQFQMVDYVVICTPNYLHFPITTHVVGLDKKVICEKPLVISSAQLRSYDYVMYNINGIVQLRYHPEVQELFLSVSRTNKSTAKMAVHIHRGEWYFKSWKNNVLESGGLLFNIGIHYFDLLCWIFGEPEEISIAHANERSVSGEVSFKNCLAEWSISLTADKDKQFRLFQVGDTTVNLTEGMENLHKKSYEKILEGKGLRYPTLYDGIHLVETLNEEIISHKASIRSSIRNRRWG